MEIRKEYHSFHKIGSYIKNIYGIRYSVYENDKVISCFLNSENLFEPDTRWVSLNKLNQIEFLEEHKIEYIVEEKEQKNIIPIGIVDFTNSQDYYFAELNVFNNDGKELYKANQFMKNIERAVEIKYEAIKFKNKFKDRDFTEETIPLK